MRHHARLLFLLMLSSAFFLGACDSEECIKCTECPDFTGEYRVMLTAAEDGCEGTAYAVGNTEIPAIAGGQMEVWLSDQGDESISLRIIQDDMMVVLNGLLCKGEESGSFNMQLGASDFTFPEVTAHYSFWGLMENIVETADGGLPDGAPLSDDYVLKGHLTVDYINNTNMNESCKVRGDLESYAL
ncbi:MAG: hypothetical protein JRF33_08935 [Deltaproteobacteria bacterium]|nr:hypothetical protein [Deltaproteobacteria bacterium]